MNKMIQRKKNNDSFVLIAVILYLLYSFYYSLLDRLDFIKAILLTGSFLFGFLSILTEKKNVKIQKKFLKFMSGWLLIILLFLFFRSWWNLVLKYRWCLAIFIAFCICYNHNRLNGIYKSIILIGFPHVIATYFFFIFRDLYPVMFNIFGEWPGGTGRGRYGFRAGISNHYSLNGIYIAIVFLSCFAYTFTLYKKRGKKLFLSSLVSLITFLSLILTMKRAHLLFSLAAILFGLIIFIQNISARQLVNIIVILLLLCGFFLWLYQKIPEIGMTLQRFENLEDDSNLTKRFEMWDDALHMFSEHPLIGIGWGGFKQSTTHNMNAHNVYIQLLAETGIIGFTIYFFTIIILGISLIRGCRIYIKRCCYDELYFSSFASLLLFFFYFFYSFSGNCLFDITFSFFVFPIATTYYLLKTENNKGLRSSESVNVLS